MKVDAVDEVKLARAAVDLDLALPWSPPIAHRHRAGTRVMACLTDWQLDTLIETLALAQRARANDPEPDEADRPRRCPLPATVPGEAAVRHEAVVQRAISDDERVAHLRHQLQEAEAQVRDLEGEVAIWKANAAEERDRADRAESEVEMECEHRGDEILESWSVPYLARAIHEAMRDVGLREGPWSVQRADVEAVTTDLAIRIHHHVERWSQGV